MTRLRRLARTYRLCLETLEARDQPSVLPFTPLDGTPWLGLDFGLGHRPHDPEATTRPHTLPTESQEAPAAARHGNDSPAGRRTTGVVPAPAATSRASADRALLLAASAASPSPEPHAVQLVTTEGEPGAAYPQPGYHSFVFFGQAGPDGPAVQYATYLGGKLTDDARAVAFDAAGNQYLTGSVESGDKEFGTYAYVVKLSPAGELIYGHVFGGYGPDAGSGLDVDRDGNAYVAGTFTDGVGTALPFVAKLNAAGDQFLWRQDITRELLPPLDTGVGGGLRLSPVGDVVHFTGTFTSRGTDFAAVGRLRTSDGAVVNGIVGGWTLVFGGQFLHSAGTGVGVDASGASYIAASSSFPGGILPGWWVFKVSPSFQSLLWSQPYLIDLGSPLSLSVDAAGNSYAAGYFYNGDQITLGLMRHTSAGQRTYRFEGPVVEGSLVNLGRAVVADAQGRSYIAGDYLTPDGDESVFLTRVTPRPVGMDFEFDLDTLTFGGAGNDSARGLAVPLGGPRPQAAVVGVTKSTDFPVTAGAYQPAYGGGDGDGFLVRTRLPGM